MATAVGISKCMTKTKSFKNFLIGPVKQKKAKKFERKIVINFLPNILNMCFGCSKEPSHREGSFEYPQHMFWLRNKNNDFQLCTLIWRPASSLESKGG